MLYANFDEMENGAELKPLSEGTDEQIVAEANRLLSVYINGYKQLGLWDRWKRNETYLDGKHWDLVASADANEPRPHTPILWSTRENLHADLTEMYPRANPQPESLNDTKKVKVIADLVNSVWDRRGMRKVWRSVTRGILDQGACFVETFWDKTLLGGLGDVNYRFWSCRKLIFDPYVADINESEGVFIPNFERRRSLIGKYPAKTGGITTKNSHDIRPNDFTGGDDANVQPDESDLVLTLQFYWREFTPRETEAGTVFDYKLCWAKIAGTVVLERPKDPAKSAYKHGRFPFTPFMIEEKEGSLYPLGLIDRFQKMQWYIDKMDQAVLCNLMASMRQKLLVDETAGIDMEALLDWEKNIVKGKNIDERSIRWFENKPYANAPMDYAMSKTAVMKDESGENQFARGEGGRGVTAMGAIMALQEKGGKRSRKTAYGLYDPMCEVAMQTVELMGEFYTEERAVIITEDGSEPHEQKVTVNSFLNEAKSGLIDMSMRMSVEVHPGYISQGKNQQAVELMQTNVISPKIGLAMMDFPDKDQVMKMIRDEEQSQLVALAQENEQLKLLIEQIQKGGGQQEPFRPPTIQPAAGVEPVA